MEPYRIGDMVIICLSWESNYLSKKYPANSDSRADVVKIGANKIGVFPFS